ncbi:hypothetical protein J2D69_23400 [Lysinibacillus sphaericus]|uniref:Uncharacterized protein n=2 Tax=Lysinibacillus TaxID=400634 RepID=B1HPJ1_LYSSC|nr:MULTISPECIES: hypothetical protein [Lysinibacillus]MBE5086001.1 hypothetical protein [Bacillus thuringiensis]ACA42193.1 hypothetical protein Bsph_4749 [Lysinibacillus sphaericus C3-41]AMO31557.1 hypothetical protein AR327_03165 [Lysinibacillus sphaericus]AMR89328.1 hypothetical protein A1T07_03505 [Lysinibacillus sphaericus]ANA47399.1 hypothetical protein A2J09_18715 [Lysinibacillus sphaericus]
MNNIIKPFKFTALYIQEHHQILKDTIADIQYRNVQKHLIDALNCIEEYDKRQILTLLLNGFEFEYEISDTNPSILSERASKLKF